MFSLAFILPYYPNIVIKPHYLSLWLCFEAAIHSRSCVTLMSDSRLVHAVSLCLCEWTNNCALYLCFVAGEPGPLPVPLAEPQCQTQRSGWHGAAQQDQWGRHRGQPQEEIHGWLHLCILCSQSQFTPWREIVEPRLIPAIPRIAEWSFTASQWVIAQCWEVMPSHWGSAGCRGQRASLCVPPPRPLNSCSFTKVRFTLVLSHCGAKCEENGVRNSRFT